MKLSLSRWVKPVAIVVLHFAVRTIITAVSFVVPPNTPSLCSLSSVPTIIVSRCFSKFSTFDDSESASKGIVGSLTSFINLLSGNSRKKPYQQDRETTTPPQSPQELLERIRDDYTTHNYLWTGDIDLAAFDAQCKFTDPTISFTGRDQFVRNLANLRPLVDALITKSGSCRSDLLDIRLDEASGYVQSRWNMVGELRALPWQPRIDVIGRTKFWYRQDRPSDDDCDAICQVVFYDEEWEIPAGKALLQLITPGSLSDRR